MTSRIVLVALAYCIAFASPLQAEENAELQGKWKIVAAQLGGQPFGKFVQDRDAMFHFRGDQVTMSLRQTDEGTFTSKTQVGKKPGQIDIKTKAPDPMVGIYRIEGNILTVCFDLSGKSRPKKFESEPSSFVLLVTLHRAGR